MLELMARGGMRVREVLKLTPDDVLECSLSVQNPKSGRKPRRFMFHEKPWEG